MPEALATATIEGRYGAYTLRVNRRAGSGGDPAVLDLDAEGDGPLLRYGQGGQPRYGLGLLGSELEAEVYDETGVLAAHFGPAAGRFDDTDYEVSLSGPNGRGGTLTWRGLPMPAGGDDPAAPLVVPARTALSARCGLGKAADAPGPAGRLTLAGLLARLRALNPLTAYGAVSLWPENDPDPGSPRLLERLEFSGPLAGGGAGDHGSLEDHLLAAARAFGWMVFQSLSGDWRALPRHRIGRAVPATRVRPAPPGAPPGGYVADAHTLGARRAEAEGLSDDGRVRRLGQVGTVILRTAGGGEMVLDGTFVYWADRPDGSPRLVYWEQSPLSARPTALGPGQTLTQALAEVSAAPDLRVRVEVEQDWIEHEVTGAPGTFYAAPADAEIFVVTPTGPLYGRPDGLDWTLVRSSMGVGVPITTDEPEGARHVGEVITGGLRAGGTLTLRLLGGQTAGPPSGEANPARARVRRASVQLVDAAGAVVAEFTVRVGDGQGEAVEVAELPRAFLYPTSPGEEPGEGVAVTGYVSGLTGQAYRSLGLGAAAERVAQQGRPLRCLVGEVEGLLGPEDLLVVPGRDDGAAWSPFATETEMVAVGLELSVKRGTTRGVWAERVVDAGRPVVAPPDDDAGEGPGGEDPGGAAGGEGPGSE